MIQEFTKEEKQKAKRDYKKEQKFNSEAFKTENNQLKAHAIDVKKKSKPGYNVGYSSQLIIS